METKYIHTAWAEHFITKEDVEDIMDTLGCCDEEKKFEDFDNWVFDQLANKIFSSIKEKIQFRKKIESDGVTYKAWLCWFDERKCLEDELCLFDERKCLEDEMSMPMRHTNKPFKSKL